MLYPSWYDSGASDSLLTSWLPHAPDLKRTPPGLQQTYSRNFGTLPPDFYQVVLFKCGGSWNASPAYLWASTESGPKQCKNSASMQSIEAGSVPIDRIQQSTRLYCALSQPAGLELIGAQQKHMKATISLCLRPCNQNVGSSCLCGLCGPQLMASSRSFPEISLCQRGGGLLLWTSSSVVSTFRGSGGSLSPKGSEHMKNACPNLWVYSSM